MVIAALLGAEEFGFATAPLVALGCIMMRVCHLNTCPVGVATQDPELRAKFTGDPAHVVNFMHFIAQEVRELMAQLGFRTINEMIGRTECSRCAGHRAMEGQRPGLLRHPLSAPMCRSRRPLLPDSAGHGLENHSTTRCCSNFAEPALRTAAPVSATLPIRNVNRAVGTMLGSEVTRRYGAEGCRTTRFNFQFNGSAGQSFGAFVPPGMTLELEGDANDYVGKGLSGGKIIVYPPHGVDVHRRRKT